MLYICIYSYSKGLIDYFSMYNATIISKECDKNVLISLEVYVPPAYTFSFNPTKTFHRTPFKIFILWNVEFPKSMSMH